MKMRTDPAKVVLCTAVCEICDTDLLYTEKTIGDGFEHRCPSCGDVVLLGSSYPCYRLKPA